MTFQIHGGGHGFAIYEVSPDTTRDSIGQPLGAQRRCGGTTATNGQLITYRFLKTGRYLVLCINRVHFLNDWMFGFVNVVGGERGGKPQP